MQNSDAHYAAQLASWASTVYDTYKAHLEAGGETVTFDEPEYEPMGYPHLVRASQLGMCPGKHAAERAGLLEKSEPTLEEQEKFDQAIEAANVVKAAFHYAQASNGYQVDTELPMVSEEHGLLGMADIVIRTPTMTLPIEVKRTYKHQQPQDYQAWQLISYMKMLDAKFGLLFCLSSFDEGYTVHPVVANGMDYQLADRFGTTMTWLGYEVGLMLGQHGRWYEALDTSKSLDVMADAEIMESPVHWQCGKLTSKDAKTTTFTPTCPAYQYCWHSKLQEAGHQSLPSKLKVEKLEASNGNYKFVPAK